MRRLASPAAVVAGCALIAVTNVALLAAAAWNRRGEPRAELALTERELALPAARQDEGGGLMLSLVLTHEAPGVLRRAARWKHHELARVDYPWLDRGKLRELGFRTDLDPSDPQAEPTYSRQTARRVHIVVEYEGAAWNRWLAGREEQVALLRREAERAAAEPPALADAEALLALDRTMRSRLFAVDAGLDPGALRRRYPDRDRYAVLTGLVRPKVVQPEDAAPALSGVLRLIVRQVHVPSSFSRRLEAFVPRETFDELDARERREAENGWPSPAAARYRADLAVGRRHEPWILNVEALPPDGAPPISPR